MSIKLKTNDGHKFGQINNIYPVGKIQISEEGIIEVETEEEAYEIANSEIGFYMLKEGDEVIQKLDGVISVGQSVGSTITVDTSGLENKIKQLTETNKVLETENKELKSKLDESMALNEELGQLLENMSKSEEETDAIDLKIDENNKGEVEENKTSTEKTEKTKSPKTAKVVTL